MKLIIREYLASLREREELDAILPDLLSEMGFTIISRPGRGTKQFGVDIAAVGPNSAGEQSVYLFSVKKGDLTRSEWNSGDQALRQSLDEILDGYIPNSIPAEHAELKIVICLCLGGEIKETIRTNVSNYEKKNTSEKISFEEWNGDKLAGLISDGILQEKLLPKELRSHFQKSVALVDEPDVSYQHFAELVGLLRQSGKNEKTRILSGRQIFLCTWILFVWARDGKNIDAAYRACELAILTIWEMLKSLVDKGGRENEALTQVLHQLILLYQSIAAELLGERILPHANRLHALSVGVQTRTWVDVNLKMFDMLGRVAIAGLLHRWFEEHEEPASSERIERLAQLVGVGFDMIENNPALFLPCNDGQATSIALFLMLCASSENHFDRCTAWLVEMASRLEMSVRIGSRYPTVSGEYEDLLTHPRSDEGYFEEATAGSTLIPLLAVWLNAFGRHDVVEKLKTLKIEKLSHTTMQLWTPDASSETHMYLNSDIHGLAVCDLPIEPGRDLADTIHAAIETDSGFRTLSPMQTGFWPIILMACRHWTLPVPPNFWIESLRPDRTDLDGDEMPKAV